MMVCTSKLAGEGINSNLTGPKSRLSLWGTFCSLKMGAKKASKDMLPALVANVNGLQIGRFDQLVAKAKCNRRGVNRIKKGSLVRNGSVRVPLKSKLSTADHWLGGPSGGGFLIEVVENVWIILRND